MTSPWADLDVAAGSEPGTFHTTIADDWQLVAVPQGGIVAAIAARAMEAELGEPTQPLRTMTSVFAGQVATGPVEIAVDVLRRGRSMSQCTATVRNPGAAAGLTAWRRDRSTAKRWLRGSRPTHRNRHPTRDQQNGTNGHEHPMSTQQ